jgi:hypothetical protein
MCSESNPLDFVTNPIGDGFNALRRSISPNEKPQAGQVPTTVTEKVDQQAAPMASAESPTGTTSARKRLRVSTSQTSSPSASTTRASLAVPGV